MFGVAAFIDCHTVWRRMQKIDYERLSRRIMDEGDVFVLNAYTTQKGSSGRGFIAYLVSKGYRVEVDQEAKDTTARLVLDCIKVANKADCIVLVGCPDRLVEYLRILDKRVVVINDAELSDYVLSEDTGIGTGRPGENGGSGA